MADTENYTCYSCGAGVAVDAKICSYCNNPVRITTFNNVWDLPDPTVKKYIKSYEKDIGGESDGGAQTAIAFCFLKLKLYDKAIEAFESALENSFDNSEVFFYYAVSQLKGKKAFMASRGHIDKAIEYVSAAIQIESRSVYHYLLAYIKYDFFKRKGYKITPNFSEELETAQSIGLSDGDIEHLYSVLSVERPSNL